MHDFYCRNSKFIKQNNEATMVMTRPRESMDGLQPSVLTICPSLCIFPPSGNESTNRFPDCDANPPPAKGYVPPPSQSRLRATSRARIMKYFHLRGREPKCYCVSLYLTLSPLNFLLILIYPSFKLQFKSLLCHSSPDC